MTQLSTRMPDLVSLQVLLAVARTGSLTAAGRECGLTHQAVSARITALEAQTVVRMVRRGATGSDLTPAGVVTAQWADRLVSVAQEVDEGLATLRAERRKRVRVHASLTIAELLLPGWLVTMRAHAQAHGLPSPEVVLTAENSEAVTDAVRDGRADVGFIESPGLPKGLRTRVIARDELLLVVPARHPWARRTRPVGATELLGTALVTRELGSGTRSFLDAALRRADPDTEPTPPVLELSTAAAVRAAVLAGAGPAVMSRLVVGDDLALHRLRAVPLTGLDLTRALRAAWTGAQSPPAGAVRELLSHIVTVTRAQAGAASAGADRRAE